MKKRLIASLLTLCLIFSLTFAFPPRASSAGTVYFTGVNSTLQPLSEDTMPQQIGTLIYVPFKVFSYSGLAVYGIPSLEAQTLHMYRGGSSARSLDFYVSTEKTVGMDNHVYEDVTAKIINGTFYVPLDFVCAYFGLIPKIIYCDPAPVIRIKSADDNSMLNDNTFIGYYSKQMQREYNDYIAAQNPATTQSPGVEPPPSSPQPPTYGDVTIYLSFRSLLSGFADDVLSTLPPGYKCCFFVTEEDILQDPRLIRRIAGSGHMVGIWLIDGTYNEYLNVSSLLFEAVKAKTLLVSSDSEQAPAMASANGLVYWPVSRSIGEDEAANATASKLPTASGTRHHLMFLCTEGAVGLLPDVIDALRQGEYSVTRITETVVPVK